MAMDQRLAGYFDYASSSPLDADVLSTMEPYFQEFYNPSALYSANSYAKSALDKARSDVAGIVGVKKSQIVFTSGCTEANNLAIHGLMQRYPGTSLLISAIEHDSVRMPASSYSCSTIPCNESGVVDVLALEQQITDDVTLISVMYINNEIGTVQPIRKIADMIKKVRTKRGANGNPLYLHVDGAQAPSIRTITQSALGYDLLSLNGGKIYGPKGSGCLVIGRDVIIEPLLRGGGQESGLRSGTENTPAIVGFADALMRATVNRTQETKRLKALQMELESGLRELGGIVIADQSDRSESITSVLFPEVDSETLVYKLDKFGLSISSGSACHARTGVKSIVLQAIGLTDQQAMNVARISIGKYSDSRSILNLLDSIKVVLA